MAFKLAVSNKVGVKVEGKSRGLDGAEQAFSFVLVCDRLDTEALKATGENKEETLAAFFERVTSDWQAQTLVLDDQDKPAAFSQEALQVLMSMYGMSLLCWHSYLQQVGAAAKN